VSDAITSRYNVGAHLTTDAWWKSRREMGREWIVVIHDNAGPTEVTGRGG